MSSFRALTNTGFQKRPIARSVWPWRCNHFKKGSPVSLGMAGVSAAFEERDAESAGGEGRTGGQSRQTTSDHGYVRSLCPGLGHQDRRLRKPFPKMTSFSRVLSATLPLNTSYWRLSILSKSLR